MSIAENTHIKMDPSWKERLQGEFSLEYMQSLREFLSEEKQQENNLHFLMARVPRWLI
jgi:uracil DNA glycosylase